MAATNYRAVPDMCLNTIWPRVAPTKKLALHNQWPQAVGRRDGSCRPCCEGRQACTAVAISRMRLRLEPAT